jgi:hypothetical protein
MGGRPGGRTGKGANGRQRCGETERHADGDKTKVRDFHSISRTGGWIGSTYSTSWAGEAMVFTPVPVQLLCMAELPLKVIWSPMTWVQTAPPVVRPPL